MSSKLSSLLVQDGVVSVKRMEEAFQRQVIFGGSLDTILLEMNVLEEGVLQRYLHAATGIAPADLTSVDYTRAQEQTRLFPRKLAEKYLIAPVDMVAGALRVLVTDPPDRGRLDELGFMLGVAIQPGIVPEFRLYQSLELTYGVKMPLRYAGLVKRLGPPVRPDGVAEEDATQPTAVPVAAPPAANPPVSEAHSTPPLTDSWDDPFAGAKPDTLVGVPVMSPPPGADAAPTTVPAPAQPAASALREERPSVKMTMVGVPMRELDPQSADGPPPDSEPQVAAPEPAPEAWAPAPEPQVAAPEPAPEAWAPAPEPAPDAWAPAPEPQVTAPAAEVWDDAQEAWVTPSSVADGPVPQVTTPAAEVWDDAQEAWVTPSSATEGPVPPGIGAPLPGAGQAVPTPPAQSRPDLAPEAGAPDLDDMPFDPRPLGFEEAVAALAETSDRDEIFALLVRCMAGYFEYAAVFTLFGEQAIGRLAIRRGVADMERVGQVSIPLTLPSIYRSTVESKGYYFGPIYDEGINFGLLAELERPVPASAFIMPVLIRNRVVCFLYADDGLRPVDPALPDSLVFVSYQISQAFQRLILKAKRADYSAASQSAGAAGKVDLTAALPRRRTASSDQWQAAPLTSGPATTRAPAVDGAIQEQPAAPSVPAPAPAPAPAPPVQPAFPDLPRKDRARPMSVSGVEQAPAYAPAPVQTPEPSAPAARDPRAITSVGFYSLTEPKMTDEVRGTVTGGEVVHGTTAGELVTGPAGTPSAPVTGESPVKVESSDLDTVVEAPPVPRTEDIWSLIDDLERGGSEGDLAAAALQRLGDPALKLVAFRFPGRLSQERMGQHGKLPPPSAHGPLVHFMVRMRERGVPYLLDLLDSDNPEVRYYATYVFAELHAPGALRPLIERVFDSAPPVRRIAVEVFKHYLEAPELRDVLDHLRAELVGPVPFRRRCSAEVLGALRDVDAVPRLMELAGDRDAETSEAAQRALLLITKQAFGDSRSKWRKWWDRNQARHRIQWLVDALSHKESECRFLASQELHQLTGETLGYRFDQDKRDREEAVRRWERWWETRGKARFLPG